MSDSKDNGWVCETVKQIKEETELTNFHFQTARSTMLINYGKNGKCRKDIVTEDDELVTMIMKICSFYEAALSNNNKDT